MKERIQVPGIGFNRCILGKELAQKKTAAKVLSRKGVLI